MTRPLIHIGMSKAASTFIQLEVLPELAGVANLGKHHVPENMKNSIMAVVRRVSITWRGVAEPLSAPLREAASIAVQQGLRPVLSEEDLSVSKFIDPETMARRLHWIFGDYDVLFIVREPFSWLTSHYLFRLQHQNPIAVLGFEEWLEYHFHSLRIGSDVAELWFSQIAKIYAEHCGGKVTVLPYETLKEDKEAFAVSLAKVLGVATEAVQVKLDAPPKASAHKLRITENKRRLFEVFRWIEWRQPERFVADIQSLSAELGPDHALPPSFAEDAAQIGVVNPKTRPEWAALIHRVAKGWPSNGAKPKLVFSEQMTARLSHLYENERKQWAANQQG
jgi:hypothetical protein